MKLGFNGSTGTDIYIIEKTVHKENIGKQILCPDCGKHFQSKSRLIQHLGSHKLNIAEDAHEILSCTDSADCKYKTTSKAYLRDHKRRMHIASAIPGHWMCFVEAPRSFWTITSIKNISKTMQMLNVQNATNHLLLTETWNSTWNVSTVEFKQPIFLGIQMSPFKMKTITQTS